MSPKSMVSTHYKIAAQNGKIKSNPKIELGLLFLPPNNGKNEDLLQGCFRLLSENVPT